MHRAVVLISARRLAFQKPLVQKKNAQFHFSNVLAVLINIGFIISLGHIPRCLKHFCFITTQFSLTMGSR